MGMSKAMMEKVAQSFARNAENSATRISITRYGNVMMSRGSVIPLFLNQIEKIAPEDLVYIDETGIDDNIVVQFGWSEKGERSFAEQSGFKTERLSIIAGYVYGSKELIAPFEFKGYTDTALFNGWFENILCPQLRPGQIVILDNASFHKSPELFEIIEYTGCHLVFLPPYSPDLNPIEKVWANFKRNLRKIIKKCGSFRDAITQAMRRTFPD